MEWIRELPRDYSECCSGSIRKQEAEFPFGTGRDKVDISVQQNSDAVL